MTSRISSRDPVRIPLTEYRKPARSDPLGEASISTRSELPSDSRVDFRLVSRVCLEVIKDSKSLPTKPPQTLSTLHTGRQIKRSHSESLLYRGAVDAYSVSVSSLDSLVSPPRSIQPDKKIALIGVSSSLNRRLNHLQETFSSLLEECKSLPSRKIREFLSLNLKSIKQVKTVAKSVVRVLNNPGLSLRAMEKSENFLVQSRNYLDELEGALAKLRPFISILREDSVGVLTVLDPTLQGLMQELSEIIPLVYEYKKQLSLSKVKLDSGNVLTSFASLGINRGLKDFVEAELQSLNDLLLELSKELDLGARKLKRDLCRLSLGGDEGSLSVSVVAAAKADYRFNLSISQLDASTDQLARLSSSLQAEELSDVNLKARAKALALIDDTVFRDEAIEAVSSDCKILILSSLKEFVLAVQHLKSYLEDWREEYTERATFFDNLEILESYKSDFIAIYNYLKSILVSKEEELEVERSAPIRLLTARQKLALSNELVDFSTLEPLRESSGDILQYPCEHYVTDSSYQSALLHTMLRVSLLWDVLNQEDPIRAIENNKEAFLEELEEKDSSSMALTCPCCKTKVLEGE
ncbi:MAG: hypothetical protein GWP59_00805 [Chlamydiales bacterium]|nr:hypothetical protein [Chlamydiales bacterium]NCF70217.1 hypothetical protein [Chlamydiales bacterium]